MHLTDEQLNEYLDHETDDRVQIEAHLGGCADCAARLRALEALFNEIESLPELAFAPEINPAFAPFQSEPARLPRSLALTVVLQALLAILVTIVAAPFVLQSISSYTPVLSMPSLTEAFLQVQNLWTAWLDALSTFSLPVIPEIPVVNVSSLFLMLTVVVVSVLWLVGNGLLLRDQNNANQENLHV